MFAGTFSTCPRGGSFPSYGFSSAFRVSAGPCRSVCLTTVFFAGLSTLVLLPFLPLTVTFFVVLTVALTFRNR